jgi:hypothetical protein
MGAPRECSTIGFAALGRGFWRAVALVAVIKAVLLLADHAPNFFMGDSAAFIGTALTKWFPPQRSWTYGYFIRWFCLPVHSLAPLIIAQTVAGLGTCVVLGFCLRRYFQVSLGVTAALMIACAIDPLQLIHERMVMAEAFSLTVLALVLAGAFSYCQSPRLVTLLILQVLFVALISLRLQFLLPVGLLVLFLPLVGNAGRSAAAGSRRSPWLMKAALHSLAGVAAMVVLHGAYRAAMGIKHLQPPAYSYGTSGLVLAAFAPVLRPVDAPSEALAAAVRDDAAFPMADRARRNDQMWEPGGLINRLEQVEGGPYRADAAESVMFRRMVRRDPVGFFLFGLRSYLDFWDFAGAPAVLRADRESGSYDEKFTVELAKNFHLDVQGYPLATLSKTMHGWIVPWLVLLLASPLLLLGAMACAGRPKWRETSLLFMVGAVLLAQNTMLSMMTTYRFLQPLTIITLLAAGIIVEGIRWRIGRQKTEAE